ncbi:hypothetical protein OPV22_013049 [Ensete ventricosum]|uniref:Uncharacterized protein n=1 Tax=Ensete ventricosum TaxID=4639 RepID=A0AAV8R057_ENSVE|nr:hypothetical protein OPV22_013049 [Ensete ventricosum]
MAHAPPYRGQEVNEPTGNNGASSQEHNYTTQILILLAVIIEEEVCNVPVTSIPSYRTKVFKAQNDGNLTQNYTTHETCAVFDLWIDT